MATDVWEVTSQVKVVASLSTVLKRNRLHVKAHEGERVLELARHGHAPFSVDD